jgi:hypothetical protein
MAPPKKTTTKKPAARSGRATAPKPKVDEPVVLNLDSVTMEQGALIQNATKLPMSELFPGGEAGFQMITGMLWLQMKQSNKTLTYQEVAKMPISVMGKVTIVGEGAPPTNAAGSTS